MIGKGLIISGITLFIAAVILVAASFAWLTLSTDPEIRGLSLTMATADFLYVSTDGSNWQQSANLSDEFKYHVELRPVSTYDGINWFLPEYNDFGELLDISEFTLDDTLEYANVYAYRTDGSGNPIPDSPLEGIELMDAQAKGHYVYTDFFLMTGEGICDVRLSKPKNMEVLQDWEVAQGIYGSFAIASLIDSGEGHLEASELLAGESALRIGFLPISIGEAVLDADTGEILKDEDGNIIYEYSPVNEGDGYRFVIYEPNADMRSYEGKPGSAGSEHTEIYVIGYTFDGDDYQDGNYIRTTPIAHITDNEDDHYDLKEIDPERLIIQRKSTWKDLSGFDPSELAVDIENARVSQYLNMGEFVSDSSFVYGEDRIVDLEDGSIAKGNASDTVVVRLSNNRPLKIRLFVWIEGQDVDCWNDISADRFLVNLEFGGTTH